MGQTFIEKIAQRFAVGVGEGQAVHSGDFLFVSPVHVMTHDNTAAVIPKFESMGAKKVFDPKQPVFALDHDIQNRSPENLAKYEKIEAFAKKQGVAFFPVSRGIGHQVMVEEGFVRPGTLVALGTWPSVLMVLMQQRRLPDGHLLGSVLPWSRPGAQTMVF